MQSGLMRRLAEDERLAVIATDKNSGLGIIDTEFLTKRGVEIHLNNGDTYKRLTRGEAVGQTEGVSRLIESFISKWSDDMSEAEYTFLKRGLKRDKRGIAKFYSLVKIHKNPHSLRPIVATCGTAL